MSVQLLNKPIINIETLKTNELFLTGDKEVLYLVTSRNTTEKYVSCICLHNPTTRSVPTTFRFGTSVTRVKIQDVSVINY